MDGCGDIMRNAHRARSLVTDPRDSGSGPEGAPRHPRRRSTFEIIQVSIPHWLRIYKGIPKGVKNEIHNTDRTMRDARKGKEYPNGGLKGSENRRTGVTRVAQTITLLTIRF